MSLKNKFLVVALLVFTSCAPITTRQTSNYKEVIAKYNTMALIRLFLEIYLFPILYDMVKVKGFWVISD